MDLYDDTDVVTDRRLPGWRARLLVDDDAGEPWGDALAPALLLCRGGYVQVAADVYHDQHIEQIQHAWRHFADHDRFTRYLRLCHGTTTVATAAAGDLTVVTFDTADYRAHTGITGPADLTGERDEWQAWLDDDVHGVIVERATPSRHRIHCGHSVAAGWVEVDAC
ncbi:hypothetical protein ABT369_02380 [Dactylosporangium sp. NPDC000244]|uniref:hypothetical protein n=1 Tax=Dactylosporangium sp. NPDC000244 TaxID=3154365 RepID=UPI0033250F27